ncbi:Hsp33 family molecular chaperone HslO [Salinicola tamaricis]|uniref:Hsp33 family molecular chaperone HslO n=1 Tax=Salinicola tamaricis TaxID=1771309 RepID=UPI003BF582BC
MVESNPAVELRGIARFDETREFDAAASLRELVGEGQIVITLDPKEGQRYQGIVALEHAIWRAVSRPISASPSSSLHACG